MAGTHHRLYEITQQVQGDPLGNALMDEVLTTCFDFTLGNRQALERLMRALTRFNQHLASYDAPIASGLFQGTPQEVSRWAEQLMDEILEHGAHS
ncbi:hypothetical protein GMST_39550 [Geomonas silvestris]|uniref:Uncharacterized protein n=1 Tax=Geomonas silvestris TaxID=2740184 RepID=A0A6V8MNP2_9BACT|nr:hypothetical protein [Geomonas silvestris]GFO61630.1 hypothetical protein GMST_39550 [Geomonas silvestris]